jgi:DNA-binding LytR/AlgR family response regulator
MNVLVVENEMPAADKLVRLLRKIDKSVVTSDIIETVEGAISRLQEGPPPDLIFMDIQLDDGLCFEIFETINVDIPVIFTTAFDEYTLRAFKVNSIDYLLKPVEEASLKAALDKYRKLYADKSPFKADFRQLLNEFRNQYKTRFLIKIGEKFKSVAVKDILIFHINVKSTFIRDLQGQDYGIDYSLEQIEGILDPRKFFRINRECIVNIESITLMHSYSTSRLQLSIRNLEKSEQFVVSRDKVAAFKKWIDR